jgi:hypothetical protein
MPLPAPFPLGAWSGSRNSLGSTPNNVQRRRGHWWTHWKARASCSGTLAPLVWIPAEASGTPAPGCQVGLHRQLVSATKDCVVDSDFKLIGLARRDRAVLEQMPLPWQTGGLGLSHPSSWGYLILGSGGQLSGCRGIARGTLCSAC